MRKLLFLAALAMLSVASALAQDSTKVRNAVCVTLKNGDAKYVAFTNKPLISTEGASLKAVSETDSKTLVICPLADVETITAVYHDFSTDGIAEVPTGMGKQLKAIFDLSGRKVENIVPGEVYILKFTDGSTKKASTR